MLFHAQAHFEYLKPSILAHSINRQYQADYGAFCNQAGSKGDFCRKPPPSQKYTARKPSDLAEKPQAKHQRRSTVLIPRNPHTAANICNLHL